MSAPLPPSPNSINSWDFLNLNVLHSIVCDYEERIVANQIEMQRLKDQLGQDYIVCRVNHISLQHKLEDHDRKFKVISVVMGGVLVAMLGMMVVGLIVVMKLG